MAATQLSDCTITEAKLMICTTIDNMLKEGDIEA
jgi:c-di-AMP phosphodiesterase-like protein